MKKWLPVFPFLLDLACVFSTSYPSSEYKGSSWGLDIVFRKPLIPKGSTTVFLRRSVFLEYFLDYILQEMSCPFYSLRVSKNGVKGAKTDISG